MAVHQAIGMEQEMKARNDARKHSQELLSVLVVEIDIMLLGIAAGSQVVECPKILNGEWTSHEGNLALQS